MSGLPWKFPHCISHTVMHGFYIHGQRAQLQGKLVLIHVSAHGDVLYSVLPVKHMCPSTPAPLLSTGRSGSNSNHLSYRQHRWETGSLNASLGLVLTTAAAIMTGDMDTKSIIISHTPETTCPGLSPWNPETLAVWSCHHGQENHQDSCEEETWASQSGLGFQIEPFYLFSLRIHSGDYTGHL
jgi:hypothetical protein